MDGSLLKPSDKDICAFSKFSDCKNPPTRWIHDKRHIRYIHGDSRILGEVNKALKISRCAVGAAGGMITAGAVCARAGERYKAGKDFKMGRKTSASLAAVGGGLALVDGIMGIVDVCTAKMPQERCEKCEKTFNTAGCMAKCLGDGGCWGDCELNHWKEAKPTVVTDPDDETKTRTIYGCFHICESCYGRLID